MKGSDAEGFVHGKHSGKAMPFLTSQETQLTQRSRKDGLLVPTTNQLPSPAEDTVGTDTCCLCCSLQHSMLGLLVLVSKLQTLTHQQDP